MPYYTTDKQNLYTLSCSTPLRIRTPLSYYRLVEGKLTYMYVRSHGKVENHVAIELYAIVPGSHTLLCLQSH